METGGQQSLCFSTGDSFGFSSPSFVTYKTVTAEVQKLIFSICTVQTSVKHAVRFLQARSHSAMHIELAHKSQFYAEGTAKELAA